MSITWNKLSGTQLGKFGLGFTGTLLKSEGDSLSLRNSTDTMFVSANLNTLALNNNSATSVTVAASVSTTESWSLVLPTNSGQSGQVLTTDGSGNSYWATVSGSVVTETLYLLEAYASVTYTLPGGFTEDVCRYSVVSNTVNVPSNWFDTSTYTFTPQKAGYWEITASYDVYRNAEASMVIKKNTSIVASAGSFNAVAQQITKIVYLNGSTDYIQIFNYGGAELSRSQYAERSWFQARWVDPIGYASSTGSVTSVNVSGGSTGLFTQGGPITSSGTITITGTLSISAGGTGASTASDALINLGAYPASNPAGYTTNTGTVTSVAATGTVNGITLSGTITTSGTIALGGTLSGIDLDTQTTGTLAVSRGGTGQTSFASGYLRSDGTALSSTASIAGSDISGNITGNAANVTGIVAIANGGTGASTASQALTNLGAYPASNPNGYTTNLGTVTSVGGSGSVNGISLSGTVTSSGNLTLGGTLSNVDLATQTTGTLSIARGGTGATDAAGALTNLGAYPASNPSGYTSNAGTVTSVGGTGTVNGITLSGSVSSSGNLTLGGSLSGVSLSTQVSGTLPVANGGTGATSAAGALTNLGAYPSSNPNGYTSNAGTVTSVGITAGTGISVSGSPVTGSGNITVNNAGVTSIVAGTGISISGGTGAVTINSTGGAGTVTSVGGTGTVNGISLSGTVSSSGNLTLGGSLSGVSLSTQVSGTLPIANGGTGATSAADALTALGAYSSSNPSGYTSNAGTVTSVGGTGTVNGISLSGSVSSSGNLTLGGTLSGVSLSTQVSGTLPIANGGTGATDAAGALTNLGAYAATNPAGYITSSSVGNGSLSLGVSGVGLSGSASFTANQSGAATFTVSSNATSAGTTADTIVSRGASGAIEVGAITANGAIVATGDITAFSDARIKDNVRTIENALSLVHQLRGVRYTRRDDGTDGIGVIAQETQSVIPEVVHETDNGMLSVAYGNIVGVLIESIKELNNTVLQLQTEIRNLKSNANSNN